MLSHSAGEMAFLTAKAYGGNEVTSILRFPFPVRDIPKGSKIALIGAGVMGVRYYIQNLLQRHCRIVIWSERENPEELPYISNYDALLEKDYEYVLIAYVKTELITKAEEFLAAHGIEKKIIYGGNYL